MRGGEWGGPADLKSVRPGLPGSVEELFHEAGPSPFLIRMDDEHASDAIDALNGVRLHRAIGVIYRPESERQSHYFHVRPADHYDAMIHIDVTSALKPLETLGIQVESQTLETYPSGL